MNGSSAATGFGQWSVENLRLTIFYPSDTSPTGLWEQLTGVSPESIDERPSQGVRREQGEAFGNRVQLVTQKQRIDWNVVPNLALGSDHYPTLAASDQAMTALQEALSVSILQIRQIHRLAFGATLVREVSSLDDGMSYLAEFLPQMDLTHRGGSDFMYQINRRRPSSVASRVQVNRLAKWQLDQFQSGAIRISPSQGPQVQTSEPSFISRLILDINTAAENNAISVSRMPNLFAELTAFAREIAVKGDVI